jgi:hypothetical protein
LFLTFGLVCFQFVLAFFSLVDNKNSLLNNVVKLPLYLCRTISTCHKMSLPEDISTFYKQANMKTDHIDVAKMQPMIRYPAGSDAVRGVGNYVINKLEVDVWI